MMLNNKDIKSQIVQASNDPQFMIQRNNNLMIEQQMKMQGQPKTILY